MLEFLSVRVMRIASDFIVTYKLKILDDGEGGIGACLGDSFSGATGSMGYENGVSFIPSD